MNKIFSYVVCLALVTFTIQSQFDMKSIQYSVKVPAYSSWGAWGSHEISNNSGKAGYVKGESMGCLCCPSMPFGVSPWKNKVSRTYVCSAQDEKNLKTESSKVKSGCKAEDKPAKEVVDFGQYYINLKSFYANLETTLKTVVDAFPDYSEGQGFMSDNYMSLCQSALSRVITTKKVNNSVESGQIITAIKGVSGVGDVSGYFPNNKFVVALDFTQVMGTSQQIAAAKQALKASPTQSTSSNNPFSGGNNSNNPFASSASSSNPF